jgi:hypothetical protein
MAPPSLEAQPSGAALVGPIDLTKINSDTLPTILQRLCDEMQALKDAFSKAERKREEDYKNILGAIEATKICNEKTIVEYSNDAENLKTFMKICKFGIAHPWLTFVLFVVTFALIDYAARYSYWDIWPK